MICEKPLGMTVRACRAIVAAAERIGRGARDRRELPPDRPNRLARAVIDSGLLGELHLMVETNIGGDDGSSSARGGTCASRARSPSTWACTTPTSSPTTSANWSASRARRSSPSRCDVLPGDARRRPGSTRSRPGVMRATGDDSLVALYESTDGVRVQLAYLPSGPGGTGCSAASTAGTARCSSRPTGRAAPSSSRSASGR